MSDGEGLEALQERLGHHFQDPELLERALTHASYANERDLKDNERLEFLGDAVLSACVTPTLLSDHPSAREGQLSRLRSRIVNTSSLAAAARELQIGPHLRLGRGEAAMGGQDKESVLADAIEALLGAIFLDADFGSCRDAVARWLGERIAACGTSVETWMDPRSELQERMQATERRTPRYRVVAQDGPPHEPVFRVEVSVTDGITMGQGEGRSKREASRRAARDALGKLDVGHEGGDSGGR